MALTRISNQSLTSVTALPAAIPTGKILQVVQTTASSEVAIASTSYTDTGVTASITPSSSSNKILVMVAIEYIAYHDNSGEMFSNARIVRDSTGVFESERVLGGGVGTGSDGYQRFYGTLPLSYLDSPSTTSATTYKVTMKNSTTSGNRQLKLQNGSVGKSTITLLEVSA